MNSAFHRPTHDNHRPELTFTLFTSVSADSLLTLLCNYGSEDL